MVWEVVEVVYELGDVVQKAEIWFQRLTTDDILFWRIHLWSGRS